mmetsp:Transcript_70857/g.122735  ORF Transcript_70857/g.122735 Transcript_70857/m.122735 type:complete len:523 (-) Transcript_70857:162-1730(-)
MARDLNDILDEIGMGRYHLVQLLLIGGVLISDGAEIMVSSSVLNALKDVWHLSGLVRGAMMSIIFVGVCAGGFIGGALADTYGRRISILTSYMGIVLFGAASAAAQDPISMVCLRFCFGASFGLGNGAGISLQVETTPSHWRGHVVNLSSLWFTLGEIYTAAILMVFMPDLTDPAGELWRYVTLLTIVPGLILLPFTVLLLHESPHFLLIKGRYEEAVATTQYMALLNGKAEVANDLVGNDPSQTLSRKLPNASEHTALVERRRSFGSTSSSMPAAEASLAAAAGSQARSVRSCWEMLFGQEYRCIVLGGAYICFLGNFMFYGLTYSLPQIFAVLKQEMRPALQILITSLFSLPGVVVAFFLLSSNRIGHRNGLAILAGMAAILQLLMISIDHGEKWIYLGLPAAYFAKWTATSFFTIAYVYLGEVFPSSYRAIALSFCLSAGRLGSISAPLLFQLCHKKDFVVGEHSIFFMITATFALIGVLVIKLALYFELKNEPLQDFAPVEGKRQEEGYSSTSPAPAG